MKLSEKIRHFLISEAGPTTVEYAIMLALIVLICVTAIRMLGVYAGHTFDHVQTELCAQEIGS